MASNKAILDWQNSLPIFGIPYTGPKDGEINQPFIESMMALEGKYKVYGQIFSGNNIRMSVSDAKKILMGDIPKEVSKDSVLLKSDSASDPSLKVWESFLSESLPIVGKVYEGDLVSAAKKMEAFIGKAIGKPMNGMIWNDAKKQFNTTTDDVKKALDLIQSHIQTTEVKKTELSLDQRVIRFSKILLEKNKKI